MGDASEVVREIGVNDFRVTTEQQLLHLDHRLLGIAPGTVGILCSGVAAVEPENAMVPIATAPKAAAARRQFSLNASRLSMIRPLFDRPGASFGALTGSLSDKGFRKFASKAQNDFVG